MAFEELLVSINSKLDESGFRALDRMETKAQAKTDMLSSGLKRMFVGVLGTFAVKSILDASVKLDTLHRSLTALAGSEAGGENQFKYLRSEADRLGQSFVVLADSYKNLFAAGTGAGWSENDIQKVFSSVLEAGTVLGSSKEQIGGALLALEQMISKGKVSMEELRRQLGNALPGAMQIAAKAMGTTSEGLQQMLKDGIKSEEFVKKFATTLHAEYGSKVEGAAHSLRAELERLGNALFFLQTALLDGDNAKGVAEAIREITRLLSSPIFLKSLNSIGYLVAFLARNLKLVIGIAVVIGIKRIADTLLILRLELLTTTFAAGSLGAALQLMVGGQVVSGLRGITAIFWAWLAPLLRIALILGVVLELVDTLRGKPTASSEIIGNMPTLEQFTQSEKFQRGWINLQHQMPWYKPAPSIGEDTSYLYNSDGSLKNPAPPKPKEKPEKVSSNNNATMPEKVSSNNNATMPEKVSSNNNATIIINAGGADAQAVANLVKTTVADLFNNYEEVSI